MIYAVGYFNVTSVVVLFLSPFPEAEQELATPLLVGVRLFIWLLFCSYRSNLPLTLKKGYTTR